MTLDTMDKRILDIIQTDFPLESRPYAIIAERLGITEQEALDRVNALRKSRLIRRLGANFQSAKLGFRSTLCAAKVPEDKLDAFIAEVNRHVGVCAAMPTTSGFPQSAPRGRPCAPCLTTLPPRRAFRS